MKLGAIVLALVWLLVLCCSAEAQSTPKSAATSSSQSSTINKASGDPTVIDTSQFQKPSRVFGKNFFSQTELGVTLVLLLFGIAVMIIQKASIPKSATEVDVARIYAPTMIIVAALVLIVLNSQNEQFAQAFGLFGTLAGYVLGRSSARPNPSPRGGGGATQEPSDTQ